MDSLVWMLYQTEAILSFSGNKTNIQFTQVLDWVWISKAKRSQLAFCKQSAEPAVFTDRIRSPTVQDGHVTTAANAVRSYTKWSQTRLWAIPWFNQHEGSNTTAHIFYWLTLNSSFEDEINRLILGSKKSWLSWDVVYAQQLSILRGSCSTICRTCRFL